MKISKTLYSIRTVTYYLEKGGIYADIITLLTQLRSDPRNRGMSTPVRILNKACIEMEMLKVLWKIDSLEFRRYLEGINDTLLLCVMDALAQVDDFTRVMIPPIITPYIDDDKVFYPKFKPIIEKYSDAEIEDDDESNRKDEIKSLEEEVAKRDAHLEEASNEIANLRHSLEEIQADGGSKADKLLTWNSILDYAESRSNYQYVNQIFRMLTDIAGRATTDEEWTRKEKIETQMLADTKPTVHNHNQISNANVIQGTINNPNFPMGTDPVIFIKTAVEKYINELNNGQG